jgi:hypothetical protein
MTPDAEVAELVDALDSKSSGAWPRVGSIPTFGIFIFTSCGQIRFRRIAFSAGTR